MPRVRVLFWGCGYSDKPPSPRLLLAVNGENGRFDDPAHPAPLRHVELGTAGGVKTRIVDVELKHLSELIFMRSSLVSDFLQDVVLKETIKHWFCYSGVQLYCTITALQAVLDTPIFTRGVFVISANFQGSIPPSTNFDCHNDSDPPCKTCYVEVRTSGL
jgi:hypothetical protein